VLDEGVDEVGNDQLVLSGWRPVDVEEQLLDLQEASLVHHPGTAVTVLSFLITRLVLRLLLSCCLLSFPLSGKGRIGLALVHIEPEVNRAELRLGYALIRTGVGELDAESGKL
jgi:hypothetical protein